MYKMYFWVRTDLGMRKGKTAGQVGHCAARLARMVSSVDWWNYLDYEVKYVYAWSGEFEPVIKYVLENAGNRYDGTLLFHIVIDQGKTQIDSGSQTVLGVFTDADLNKPTQFKLL